MTFNQNDMPLNLCVKDIKNTNCLSDYMVCSHTPSFDLKLTQIEEQIQNLKNCLFWLCDKRCKSPVNM